MRNILITGGAGFIGSNFIRYLLKTNEYFIVNLDLLTYAGSLDNLADLDSNYKFTKDSLMLKTPKIKNYHFFQGDINDRNLLNNIFHKYKIDSIIHFAAESHVDNSINEPNVFIKTNINGTFTLLDSAFRFWFNEPFSPKADYKKAIFHHISTDEVYGSLGKSGYFSESTPYAPNSPYSASKASSDMLVRSYAHTYGLNAVITNCSNNYGEYQHDEKLIPTIIRNALRGDKIPIYGDGKNVRDWLYVQDHCDAILNVFNYALKNLDSKNFFDTFNIGGNEEHENLEIAHIICNILDKKLPKDKSYKEQITFVKDRFGHDRRYAIDSSKIKKILNWTPKHTFESGIEKTIDFYIKKYGI